MNIVTDGSTFLKKQDKPPMKRCPEIIQWTLSISILPGTSKFVRDRENYRKNHIFTNKARG